jgi:hypothetical protein
VSAIATGQQTSWRDESDDYEYAPLRLDPAVSRSAATTMLSLRAEFAGWELARTLGYPDGSRRVWLRRKRTNSLAPGLSL